MVKFIWQHNIPMEFYSTFEMPPRRMNFGALQAANGTPNETPEQTVREVSQSGF